MRGLLLKSRMLSILYTIYGSEQTTNIDLRYVS